MKITVKLDNVEISVDDGKTTFQYQQQASIVSEVIIVMAEQAKKLKETTKE